jgi:flagellar biogenesis protein FliO
MALPPPTAAGDSRSKGDKEGTSLPRPSGSSNVTTILGSLGLVLGLFFIVAWVMRRTTPGHYATLPKDVVEVLGRSPLAARQQVHLIRLGAKLVLISVTPTGVESLSEVTDPAEVERLVGLCQQSQPNSATTVFRQVLQQFNREHERMGSPAAVRRSASAQEAGDA